MHWNGVGDLILSLSGTLGHVEVSQDDIKVERVEEIMQVGHYGQAAVGSVVGSWC